MASTITAYLWGILFAFTFVMFVLVPTKIVVNYWLWLNAIVDLNGNAIYTYALFAIFGYIICIIISLINLAACARAFVQSKKGLDDVPTFGIPRAVKGYAVVTSIFFVALFAIYYFLFGVIAIFSLVPPPLPV